MSRSQMWGQRTSCCCWRRSRRSGGWLSGRNRWRRRMRHRCLWSPHWLSGGGARCLRHTRPLTERDLTRLADQRLRRHSRRYRVHRFALWTLDLHRPQSPRSQDKPPQSCHWKSYTRRPDFSKRVCGEVLGGEGGCVETARFPPSRAYKHEAQASGFLTLSTRLRFVLVSTCSTRNRKAHYLDFFGFSCCLRSYSSNCRFRSSTEGGRSSPASFLAGGGLDPGPGSGCALAGGSGFMAGSTGGTFDFLLTAGVGVTFANPFPPSASG